MEHNRENHRNLSIKSSNKVEKVIEKSRNSTKRNLIFIHLRQLPYSGRAPCRYDKSVVRQLPRSGCAPRFRPSHSQKEGVTQSVGLVTASPCPPSADENKKPPYPAWTNFVAGKRVACAKISQIMFLRVKLCGSADQQLLAIFLAHIPD